MRILLVDDDEILVSLLKQSLTTQRHVIDVAKDGQMAWDYVKGGEYELILLDINLPELDGISLCKKLRSEGYSTPILLMTAKDATQDRIRGLDAGADDYLTKPLDLGELNARIRALSRRGEVIPTTIVEVNGLVLDPSSCAVSYQQQPIKLTAKEYSLLELFLRNPSRVFSRAQILDRIWTFDDPPLEESVKAHIKGLRKKLKQAGVVDWIENIYGIGYRLNPKVSQSQAVQETASSVEQKFNQKMEQMWQQYQDLMAERLEVLRTATLAVKKAQFSPELHHCAERAAHKLAGVLGMFSRETGTTIAREIETLLQENKVLHPSQENQFISLVEDLDSLLGLNGEPSSDSPTNTPKLLLISSQSQISQELQQLARSLEMSWQQVDNIDNAKVWLQANTPYLVVIDLETSSKQPENLALITELAARTPPVPVLVLAAEDRLIDRVTVARAGASGFLVKPVTATTVWHTVNQLWERHQAAIASVLVVDDDIVFLSALRSMLEPWGIRVTTLENPLRFWQVLQTTNPNLLILDVEMPEINGIELCQALRSDPNWQELPILFLTACQDIKTIQQVFEVGADDYISKPVVGAELLARINNRLERSRLLHNLATQDPLTGLKNRPQGSRELESILQQARQNQQPFSLAVLGMPELRQINLKYGHCIGDRILQQWGKVMQAAFRSRSVSSYWGNGDFVVGMPNLNKIEAQEHLAEVLAVLRKQIFTALNGDRFQVSCYCSVAEFPGDGLTLHSLYQSCCQN